MVYLLNNSLETIRWIYVNMISAKLLGMNRKPELTSLTVIEKIENLLDPVYGASCDEERRSLAYPSYSPSSSSNSPSSSAVASSLKDMFSATYMGKSEILYFIAST